MTDFDWLEYADIERKRLRENESDVEASDEEACPICEGCEA
jgi:hypothetical protein